MSKDFIHVGQSEGRISNARLKRVVAIMAMAFLLNSLSAQSSTSAIKSASCFYMSYGQATPTSTGANFIFSLSSTCSKEMNYQVRYLNVSLIIQGIPVGFAYVQGPIKDTPINSFMTLNFAQLSPGNYPAFISIMDDSGFIWQSPAGNINVAKASVTRSTSKYVCVSASKFKTSCQIYPDWSFEFCSKLSTGTLQEYVGSKWKSLWKIEGTEDFSTCDENFPYFVEVSGTTSLGLGKNSKMRVLFKGTSTEPSFSQNFSLAVKK